MPAAIPTITARAARAARVLAALATAAIAAPTAAAAQSGPQPTAFVHGFLASGQDWAGAPERLRQRFYLDPVTPTMGWNRPLGDQAVSLRDVLAARSFPDTAILIGHSNGGLISRLTSRLRPAKGIATVGTLHRGAPLSQNLEWAALLTTLIYYDNALPVMVYGSLNGWGWDSWDYYLFASFNAEMAFAGLVGMGATAYFGLSPSVDVLSDMHTYSGTIETLNSDENLYREATQLRARVGITSRTPDSWGLMWWGLIPGGWANYFTWLQYVTPVIDFIAFDYYLNYWNYDDPYMYDKQAMAWLWLLPAFTNLAIDPSWCAIIGAWSGGCEPSDGIVPVWSQYYPGAKAYDIFGPSHQEEKGSEQFYQTMVVSLQNDFVVTNCAATGLRSMSVSPSYVDLWPGSVAYLAAYGVNGCGGSAGGLSASWSSTDPWVASVDEYGTVTAHSPGSTTIYASYGGFTASAYVSVQSTTGPCDDYYLYRTPCAVQPYRPRGDAPEAAGPRKATKQPAGDGTRRAGSRRG